MPSIFKLAIILALFTLPSSILINQSNADVIEIYNGSSEPATTPIGLTYSSSLNNIGWYYTPSISYELTRIETKFNQPFTYGGNNLAIVTVYSERPSVGGSVLGTGNINIVPTGFGSSAPWQGTDFQPISLSAGSSYFIGFTDMQSEGVNVASWNTINGTPTLNGDTDLGAYYYGNGFSSEETNSFQNAGNGGRPAGASPILRFNGIAAVPEPASCAVVAALGAFMVAKRSLKRTLRIDELNSSNAPL